MALAECLLYEGRSLESARGPQSFRTIPSRQLLTGEPCAGEPHARFGGRGVRLNRTSLPLLCYRRYAAGKPATGISHSPNSREAAPAPSCGREPAESMSQMYT